MKESSGTIVIYIIYYLIFFKALTTVICLFVNLVTNRVHCILLYFDMN